MDKLGRGLVNDWEGQRISPSCAKLTDSKQGPGDCRGASSVAFLASEGISSGGSLEEDKGEEDEDLGPDARLVGMSVDAKCLKEGEDDENNSPC